MVEVNQCMLCEKTVVVARKGMSYEKKCGWGKEGMFCKETVVGAWKPCCMKKAVVGAQKGMLY